ncbi:RNA pol II accessory factor, Cdc73 family-domain-containing protein [Naematelia encephala]|uniref:RNA pol II accessory factor, Cdc73 family-domain-containing protein n=1 Tax=Naematelia encephala TaxID=71784 RepID=A0A1Y2BL71_9TREE|nr:RNA pol II accessory factor, Cdc73 family-domain-containing protein [Naematelia encephala]
MTSQDPLDLFRACLSSSNPPTLLTAALEPAPTLPLASYISFPGTAETSEAINIPKDTPTRYTSKTGVSDDFYTLGQIWLAWSERESGVRDYLVKGQQAGVGYVSVADRRGVVEYLLGEGDGGGRVRSIGEETGSAASAAVEELNQQTEAGPSNTSAPAKRKYEVDVTDRDFCRKVRAEEVELRDRNSVLRASNGGKINNFSSFLQTVMHDKIRAMRAAVDNKSSKNAPSQSQPTFDSSRPAKKARSNNPIIMISSSPTALITMWNVKRFLEDGIFEPSEVARQNEAMQGNTRVEDMIPVLRKRTGPGGERRQSRDTCKYYVVDGVEALQKFGQDAWDRVICVLTTGQAWQFRPYKWQDPKTLFRNVKGVYFQWTNEPVNPAVRDWNVTEMRIDKNKRHTDRQVVAEFWRQLDAVRRR